MLFVGIDGEMSSPDIEKGGKLIQIGLALRTSESLESINYLIKPSGDMFWSEQAEAVHGIDRKLIEEYGIGEDIVDSCLYRWLTNHGANPKHRAKTVPVGFNITGFDMPFIKAQLPKTYSLLSRRTAELNGMLWLLDGKIENGMPVGFEKWKEQAKDYAKEMLDDYKPHDAEWDAKRHLLCLEYFKSVI